MSAEKKDEKRDLKETEQEIRFELELKKMKLLKKDGKKDLKETEQEIRFELELKKMKLLKKLKEQAKKDRVSI